ncbi:MAG: hypothetical protein GY803_30595 [Chloroflexi bacterium]|nr:hypothetical protein [Chloroflexota bacterium]
MSDLVYGLVVWGWGTAVALIVGLWFRKWAYRQLTARGEGIRPSVTFGDS